jgi:hypothetical protein
MNIDNYKILISNLPVRQQCFTTKRTTWTNAENEIQWLKDINNKLFGNNRTLTISRQDIFETSVPRETIIKTIYWGYPAGMQGNHFVSILKSIDIIEKVLLTLRKKPKPDTKDFEDLKKTFKNVDGIGLSTYSKLLYFFKITFNDNPCLILDRRLIDVFASGTYSNFKQLNNIRYYNAENMYLDYLQLIRQLANDLDTKGENIELFLFTFGKNLKTTNMTETKISNMWN